jgi:hypothetical protein
MKKVDLIKKFEVEFRCHFNTPEEAHQRLPFLHPGLQRSCTWQTTIYGLETFRTGILVRTAEVAVGSGCKYYVGWKGPDTGTFANIRQEVDEEIAPGSPNSRVLEILGGRGKLSSLKNIAAKLEQSGYLPFMSFTGTDFTGYYEPYDVKLKLMTCAQLKWPLLVEIEKTADSAGEALKFEKDLQDLCRQFHLEALTVREEPPTLLYESVFGQKP